MRYCDYKSGLLGSATFASLLFAPSAVHADESWTFLVGLSNFRHVMNTDETPSGLAGKETREYTFANLSLGYNIGFFSVGARYIAASMQKDTSLKSTQGNTMEEDSLNIWGPMVGYVNDRFMFQLALVPFGAKEHKFTTIGASGVGSVKTAKYAATIGEILDVGYSFEAKGMKFGPLLSFTTLKYGKKTQDGRTETLSPRMGDDFVVPSLSMRVDF